MSAIMIDIETLGTSHNSVILSIGAVEFDDHGITNTFEVNVDPVSCTDAGLVIDARTVMWWLDQSKEAQAHLTAKNPVPLRSALESLATRFIWNGKKVWCNGVDFDFPILENAYKAAGWNRAPWAYYDKMDYRTLKNLVPKAVYEHCKIDAVVKHSAGADAEAQALTAIKIMHMLDPTRHGS